MATPVSTTLWYHKIRPFWRRVEISSRFSNSLEPGAPKMSTANDMRARWPCPLPPAYQHLSAGELLTRGRCVAAPFSEGEGLLEV
eukprot:1544241-Rhodomonas_salina.2